MACGRPSPCWRSALADVAVETREHGAGGGVTTVFIDGAHGTTGLEIRERLADRADLSLIALPHDRRREMKARAEALNDADFAILCLPDDAAAEAVALIGSDTRVIDASSRHRTTPGWIYGLPELVGREPIAAAGRVGNPGCYPTGFLLLVAPLVNAGLIGRDSRLIVNAVSGYSGGGNALIDRFAAEPSLGWRGYSYRGEHKHLPEMRIHAGLDHAPLFAPAVVRAFRGMMVEVPLPDVDAAAVRATLAERYAEEPLVTFGRDVEELRLEEGAKGSDGVTLHVFASPDGRQARLVAMLDNLGKGAAGAAVQNLNLMVGAPELTGLRA